MSFTIGSKSYVHDTSQDSGIGEAEITAVHPSQVPGEPPVYDVTLLPHRPVPLAFSGVPESALFATPHDAQKALKRFMQRLLADFSRS